MKKSKIDILRAHILEDIRSGVFPEGEKLDSVRDLALDHKISVATVVKTLTRMADEGYLQIAHGKSTIVRRRPSPKVALLYSNPTRIRFNPFLASFYEGAARRLEAEPGEIQMQSFNFGIHGIRRGLEMIAADQFSGLLFLGSCRLINEEYRTFIRKLRLPVIWLFDSPNEFDAGYFPDYPKALAQIFARLKARNRKKLLYFGAPENLKQYPSAHNKFSAVKEFTERYGIGFLPLAADYTSNPDYTLSRLRTAFTRKNAADCIFLNSDALAAPVLRAIYEAKLRCPDDIPIVSFDNLAESRYSIPQLTSIELDREQLGELGMDLMLRCLRGEAVPEKPIMTPVKTIFRDSLPQSWSTAPFDA